MNFPFGTNGNFIILGVPILKHIRVMSASSLINGSDEATSPGLESSNA